MKMRMIFLLALLATSQICFSQQTSNDAIKTEILKILSYPMAKGLVGGGLRLPGQFIMEDDKVAGVEIITNASHWENEFTLKTIGKPYFVGNELNSVIIHSGLCKTTPIPKAGVEFEHDAQNRIAAIKETSFYKMSAGYMRDSYQLEYDANNRISAVVKTTMRMKGKTSRDLTEDFSFKVQEAKLEWSNDGSGVTIKVTSYKPQQKAKDPSVADATNTFIYGISDGNITSYQQVNDKGVIMQDLRTTLTKDSVVVVAINHQYGTKQVNTYNLSGSLIMGSSVKEFDKEGNLVKRFKTVCEYTYVDEQKDICKAKQTFLGQEFDASGNVISERTPTHTRRKNPDGSWGEWKLLTY